MKLPNYILQVLLVLLLFLVFACSKDYSKEIVGRWRNTEDGAVINFREDGRWQSGFNSGRYNLDGSKIIIDDGERKLEIVSLEKNVMELRFPSGKEETYKKD